MSSFKDLVIYISVIPPAHLSPLYRCTIQEISNPPSKKMHEFDGWKTFFEIPHWMHLSFISYDRIGSTAGASVEKKANGMWPV